MGSDDILKTIERKIRSLQRDPRLLQAVGEKSVDIIYKRVKSGLGVVSDELASTKSERLTRLSPSYINYRKGKTNFVQITKGGKTWLAPLPGKGKNLVKGEFGSPARSNLTFTGEMLKALSWRVTGGGLSIYIKKTRRKDGLTNDKVAEYVRVERPFLALTDGEQRILTQLISKKISELLKI